MKRRLLFLGAFLVMAGCVSAGAQPSRPLPASPQITPSGGASPVVAPTAEPSPTAHPTPTAQPVGSPEPSPSPSPDEAEPMPPLAYLTLPDGSLHAAALGSYDYDGAAADAPWLPARILPAVDVRAGSQLSLSVAPLHFVRWGARYADARDEQADVISPLAAGGDGVASLENALLPAPPSGSWVLMVQLYFADEEGDAAYYWHLRVP
jgi:hypothetical protein